MDKLYYVPHAIEEFTFIQETAIYAVFGCYGVGKTHFLDKYLLHSHNYTVVNYDLNSEQGSGQEEINKKFFLRIWDRLDDEEADEMLRQSLQDGGIPLGQIEAGLLFNNIRAWAFDRDKRKTFEDDTPDKSKTLMSLLKRLEKRKIQKKFIWCITNVQNKFSEIHEIISLYKEIIKYGEDLDKHQMPILVLEGWHSLGQQSEPSSEVPESKASLVEKETNFSGLYSNLEILSGRMDVKEYNEFYIQYITCKMKEIFNGKCEQTLKKFAIILLEWVGPNFRLIETSLTHMNRVKAYMNLDLDNDDRLENEFNEALSTVFKADYPGPYRDMLGKLRESLSPDLGVLNWQESFDEARRRYLYLRGVCFYKDGGLHLIKLIKELYVSSPPPSDSLCSKPRMIAQCAFLLLGSKSRIMESDFGLEQELDALKVRLPPGELLFNEESVEHAVLSLYGGNVENILKLLILSLKDSLKKEVNFTRPRLIEIHDRFVNPFSQEVRGVDASQIADQIVQQCTIKRELPELISMMHQSWPSS
jgi:hypothetical protein